MPWPEPCLKCGHHTMHSSGYCRLCREKINETCNEFARAAAIDIRSIREHEKRRLRKLHKRQAEKALKGSRV